MSPMEFIAATWGITLIIGIVCWMYVFFKTCACRTEEMGNANSFDSVGKVIFDALFPTVFVMLFGTICFLLAMVGAIVNFISSI